MALTWTRLLQILNGGIAVFSLTLVGIAPACLYLTSHGMQWMNQMWRPGLYEWYRGEGPWGDQHHFVTLSYDTVNEGLILAAASVSLLAGLIGAYGAFLRRKVSRTYTEAHCHCLTLITERQTGQLEIDPPCSDRPRRRDIPGNLHRLRLYPSQIRRGIETRRHVLLARWLRYEHQLRVYARTGCLWHRRLLHQLQECLRRAADLRR